LYLEGMIRPTPEDPRDDRGPDSWVAVERYFDPISAGLGQALLENAGIEARVFDAEAGALGAYATGIGGIRLMVRAADLDAARAALETGASGDAPEVPESEDILSAARYCSVCHSTDIEVGERRTPADASLFMRLWDKVFGPAPLLRCRRCDHAWGE
jgi:hypothetical protein